MSGAWLWAELVKLRRLDQKTETYRSWRRLTHHLIIELKILSYLRTTPK